MKNSEKSAEETQYEGYYKAIEDVSEFSGSSLYYNMSLEMAKVNETTYAYYVFVDQAQTAMYDVVVMAIENDLAFDETGAMMPSIGIFEDVDYNMIPYQSYIENGFVKGLVISGETTKPEVSLKILVEWNDRTGEHQYREFHSFVVNLEGYYHPVEEETVVVKKAFNEATTEPKEQQVVPQEGTIESVDPNAEETINPEDIEPTFDPTGTDKLNAQMEEQKQHEETNEEEQSVETTEMKEDAE